MKIVFLREHELKAINDIIEGTLDSIRDWEEGNVDDVEMWHKIQKKLGFEADD